MKLNKLNIIMPNIDINLTRKKIASFFQGIVEDLPEDAKLVNLSANEVAMLKKCRSKFSRLILADSQLEVLSFVDNANDTSFYVMICGNFTLVENDIVSEIEPTSMWIYPLVEFFNMGLRDGISHNIINEYIWPYTRNDGHVDQSKLIELFPLFRVYRITQRIDSLADFALIANMAFLDQPKFHRLQFKDALIDEFKNSLSDTSPDSDTLAQAFTADRWEYCFFALYRCLEPLFNNLLAKTLKKELSIGDDKSHFDITEILRKNSLVMPEEKLNISTLFSKFLSDELKKEFCNILNKPADTSPGAIGQHIYNIRNRIVHHPNSASSKRILLSNSSLSAEMKRYDWPKLCLTLLRAYRLFKNKIPA